MKFLRQFGYWGRSKPPRGSKLNREHPYLPNEHCLLLNTGAGREEIDLANPLWAFVMEPLASTSTMTPLSWSASKYGVCVRSNAITDGGHFQFRGDRFGAGLMPTAETAGTVTNIPRIATTILVHKRKTDSTNRASTLFGGSATSGVDARCGAHVPFSDGIVYWDFQNTTTGRLTRSGLTFGDDIWAFRVGPNFGQSIWQNGVKVAEDITLPPQRTNPLAHFLLNQGNGNVLYNGGDLCEIDFFYMWNYELPDDIIRQLSSQPYSIVQPPSYLFYVPLSTPGAQTLSPDSIASAEAFGSPTVSMNLLLGSIASAEAFGSPTLGMNIFPAGISSGEAFGVPEVAAMDTCFSADIIDPDPFSKLIHVEPVAFISPDDKDIRFEDCDPPGVV